MRSRWRSERGDLYLEFLVCLILFVACLSFTLQLYSAVRTKLWLDQKAEIVARSVAINGAVTEHAEALLSEITEKLGPDTTVVWETTFWEDTRKIQLGELFELRITGKVPLFQLGHTEPVTVSISTEVAGTSEIYWKSP